MFSREFTEASKSAGKVARTGERRTSLRLAGEVDLDINNSFLVWAVRSGGAAVNAVLFIVSR